MQQLTPYPPLVQLGKLPRTFLPIGHPDRDEPQDRVVYAFSWTFLDTCGATLVEYLDARRTS